MPRSTLVGRTLRRKIRYGHCSPSERESYYLSHTGVMIPRTVSGALIDAYRSLPPFVAPRGVVGAKVVSDVLVGCGI